MQAREGWDQWAIKLQDSINRVQARIKVPLLAHFCRLSTPYLKIAFAQEIHRLIGQLEVSQHLTLWLVCKEVMGNATPPTRIREGYNTCALTGVHVEVNSSIFEVELRKCKYRVAKMISSLNRTALT